MAAKQASEVYQKAKVIVIETNSIAKCYSALTMLDLSSNDLDSIINDIMMTIDNVVDAEITYSIRDSKINDVEINKDDFMGFVNHKIVCSTSSKLETFKQVFDHVINTYEKEVVSIIVGKDVTEKEKEDILSYVNENHRYVEVGFIEGKQDIYSFIISFE